MTADSFSISLIRFCSILSNSLSDTLRHIPISHHMALILANRLRSSYLSGAFFKISEISKIHVTAELTIIINCYSKLYINKEIVKHVRMDVEHIKIISKVVLLFQLYRTTHAE